MSFWRPGAREWRASTGVFFNNSVLEASAAGAMLAAFRFGEERLWRTLSFLARLDGWAG
jgi:hypothetical protein